jgi:hypothetical protein
MTTASGTSRLWLALLLGAPGIACNAPAGESDSADASTGGTGSTGGDTPTTSGDTPTTTSASTSGEPTTITGEPDTTTGDDTGPEPPAAYEQWLKVEIPGTVCGNGSQYKFFINYKEGAKDLMVMLEPGGACWDYASCSGKSDLSAAHLDGVPDDLMSPAGTSAYISPLIRRDLGAPTADWNLVYVPYCTGDVHTGNNVITYEDPEGVGAPIVFQHAGHANVLAISEYLAGQFPMIDRLFVTGCSAGGAGSLINYYFFRSKLAPARGYMMDDSGPIFPSTGKSAPLHAEIRQSWNVDSIFAELPAEYPITDDFGVLNTHLADMFPEDRLSTIFFQRDFNYSRYSYERFYPQANSKDDLMGYWASDTKLLVNLYNTRDNLGYYLPYWRALNDSHCVSIASYIDTDIEELGINLEDYVNELFDDNAPMGRYMESVQPDEDD